MVNNSIIQNKNIYNNNLSSNTLTNNRIYYLFIASIEAKKSPLRCKHGCIIVKGNTIIGKGYNKYNTYNRYGVIIQDNIKTKHAETEALYDCILQNKKKDLKNADLYVVRFDINNNKILYSKPCSNCSNIINKYIEKFGLRYIYYSTNMD